MLNKEYANTVFNGVRLCEMTIDQLRESESELTKTIISQRDWLTRYGCSLDTLCNSCGARQNYVQSSEHGLDIIKSEIAARYVEMTV